MRPISRVVAIVLGSAELGSAIAVRLNTAGAAVVMCDTVDPQGIRRGMSFADAWYVGVAYLEELEATFCSSLRSVPTLLSNPCRIAATTWSWPAVAEALAPAVVIDARCNYSGAPPNLIADAPPGVLTVGVAPWFVPGENTHIRAWPYGRGTRAEASASGNSVCDPLSCEPRRRVVLAPVTGRFYTHRHIGEFVLAGDSIGSIGSFSISAPVTGVLSGLLGRGSRPDVGAPVLEVDTNGQAAQCFGIPAWCEALAADIAVNVFDDHEALGAPRPRSGRPRREAYAEVEDSDDVSYEPV